MKRRMIGYILFFFLILISIVSNVIVTFQEDLGISVMDVPKSLDGGLYVDTIYVKPWARLAPYAFGIIAGMFYFEYKGADRF